MPVNTSLIEKLIPLADAHQAADEYIAGTYWNSHAAGGCAVGCTIHDAVAIGALPPGTNHNLHRAIAEATGLPEVCWLLMDSVFEGLALAHAPHGRRGFCVRTDLPASRDGRPEDHGAARSAAGRRGHPARVQSHSRVRGRASTRRANGDEPAGSEWEAARQQADAARQQAEAAWQQASVAWQQATAARQQAKAVRHQAEAARHDAVAMWHQVEAARQQADAEGQQWWSWCADMVVEELRSFRGACASPPCATPRSNLLCCPDRFRPAAT